MDVDDVRMVELRRRARLGEEAVPHPLAIGEAREHHLDGDAAVELEVVREEHGGHAAAAELALDLVLAQRRAPELLEELHPRIEPCALAADQRGTGDRVAARAAEPVARRDGRATAWTGD